MSKVPIKHRPEKVAALAARYAKALEHVFDVEAIEFSGAKRPGEMAECVFDFEDGLRLIVSRDRFPNGDIKTHVSASARVSSELYQHIKFGSVNQVEFCAMVTMAHAEISGTKGGLELLGFSEGKMVPHFLVVEQTLESFLGTTS